MHSVLSPLGDIACVCHTHLTVSYCKCSQGGCLHWFPCPCRAMTATLCCWPTTAVRVPCHWSANWTFHRRRQQARSGWSLCFDPGWEWLWVYWFQRVWGRCPMSVFCTETVWWIKSSICWKQIKVVGKYDLKMHQILWIFFFPLQKQKKRKKKKKKKDFFFFFLGGDMPLEPTSRASLQHMFCAVLSTWHWDKPPIWGFDSFLPLTDTESWSKCSFLSEVRVKRQTVSQQSWAWPWEVLGDWLISGGADEEE